MSFVLHVFLTLSASLVLSILAWGLLSRTTSAFNPETEKRRVAYVITLVAGLMPIFMPVHLFLLITLAFLMNMVLFTGGLLSKAWAFSLGELEFFGGQASAEARRPVYILSALLFLPVFLATSLSFWHAVVGLVFACFIIFGFGRTVFSGAVQYSNDFNVIDQDGKPMSSASSFIYIALRTVSSFFTGGRWFR